MAKGSSYEALAREAADRMDRQAAVGQQLSLLPEAEVGAEAAEARAARGKGKAQSELRKWLAATGARMPEDVLAQIGGLDVRGDAIEAAMAKVERILAWAGDASSAKRLGLFQVVYGAMIRANEALLPYGLAKVTPDVAGGSVTNVFNLPGSAPAAPQDPAAQARDVTPKPSRIAPPPLPHEMQQNQGVAKQPVRHSDGDIRTDEVKR
jgi:hypothetical protein